MEVRQLDVKPSFQKYTINDTEHLISELRSLMPLKKDIVILNIEKYGYEMEQDYILKSLGFTISKKKKLKITKETEQQVKIFNVLFQTEKECYIRIRNKKTEQYRTYNTKILQDPYRLQAILKSQYFDNTVDMMYSLNAYNNMYKATDNCLFSLQNFALDVDFDTNKYTLKEVLNMIKKMYKDGEIPTPNLIEWGHRVRLIYSIVDVPATLKAKKLLNKVIKKVNAKIPKELNSKGQALTTYARVNGSTNSKNNATIKTELINPNKYILRELQDKFLDKKNTNIIKKSNSKIIFIRNYNSLNVIRIKDLEKIQTIRQDGHRELLCYLYRNYCLVSGMDKEQAWEKLKNFNNNFRNPLRINKLDSNTKHLNRKQYLHKNSTILDLLDIDSREEIKLNLKTIISKAEYKRRQRIARCNRYKNQLKEQGKISKKDELIIIREKIKILKIDKVKNKDISKKLQLPQKTVERHITFLKKQGLL